MIDFRGQTAIVTGADRAVGRELALLLASRGASLLLVGRSGLGGQGGPAETAAAIRASGGQAVVLAESVDPAVESIVELAGECMPVVDILINAGSEVKDRARLMRKLWPAMRARGYGRVLNVLDQAGASAGGTVPDGAARAALIALTREAATRGQGHGILINAIVPASPRTQAFVRRPAPMFQPECIGVAGLTAVAVAYFVSREMPHTGMVYAVGGGRITALDPADIASTFLPRSGLQGSTPARAARQDLILLA